MIVTPECATESNALTETASGVRRCQSQTAIDSYLIVNLQNGLYETKEPLLTYEVLIPKTNIVCV